MKKCVKCHVEVLDETYTCPLCLSVLEEVDHIPGTRAYPEAHLMLEQYHLLKRLFIFILIAMGMCLSVGNYLLVGSVFGYVLIAMLTIYFVFTLKYFIVQHANGGAKILGQTILIQLLLIIIDYMIGYKGWSMNIALPSAWLLASVGILVLMLVNRKDWQEYIMYQISVTVLSMSQLLLIHLKIINWPVLAILSTMVSVLILIGMIVFGNKSVSRELSRRFHTK